MKAHIPKDKAMELAKTYLTAMIAGLKNKRGGKRMNIAKDDSRKPRLDLVPPALIEAVGIIRDYGTRKYGNPENWRQVAPERYRAAMMRHLCRYLRDPGGVDDESGYPHLWHLACNVAFLIALETPEPMKKPMSGKTHKL